MVKRTVLLEENVCMFLGEHPVALEKLLHVFQKKTDKKFARLKESRIFATAIEGKPSGV